jgi:hypothetical protein
MKRLFTLAFTLPCMMYAPMIIAQNVGIGTATPLEKLHIIGNVRSSTLAGAGSRIVLADLNGTLLTATGATSPNSGLASATNFIGTTDNIDFRMRTNNVERITIKNNGFIGLFNNAPLNAWMQSTPPTLCNDFQFKWDNALSGDAAARFQNSLAANGNRVFLGVTNYDGTAFAATAVMGLALNTLNTAPLLAGAEGVRGFSNSNAGIGVRGGFTGGTLATAVGWAVYAGGWAGGLSAWLNVSDARLKKNVTTIENALEKLMMIRGVEYEFNNEKYPGLSLSHEKQLGFFAQEIEQVFPNMVHDKAIPADESVVTGNQSAAAASYQLKAVAYTDMVPVLVEAVKEQQQIIEKLQARISALESEKK